MAISFPFAGLQAQCHGQHKGRDNQRPAQQGRAECGNVAVANGIVGNAVVPVGIRVLAPVPCSIAGGYGIREKEVVEDQADHAGHQHQRQFVQNDGQLDGRNEQHRSRQNGDSADEQHRQRTGDYGQWKKPYIFPFAGSPSASPANPGKTDGRTDRRENGPP